MSMRPPASRRVRTPAIALALLVIVQSGPGGLWILSWRGKRARYARCRLTPCRRRVSHNTLDAADGAHRLHRHFRRTLDQDVKIGSRRPVTLRHRKEGTDRASSLRSDERSRSPKSVFTFSEIPTTSATYAVSSGGQFSVSPGGQFRMSLDSRYRARLERYILPSLGSKAVDAVTVGDCYALIDPLWHGTGSKGFILRHQLVHVFAWAVAHEHRVDNPGDQVLRRLPKVKSRRKHRPSLPYVRVSAALAALDAADVAPVARLAISFLILTACRLREVTEARWSEFDLDDRLWTIPPSRMKKRRRHRVPLSTQALRILAEARSLDPSGVLVFGFRNGRRPPRALGSGQISAVLAGSRAE